MSPELSYLLTILLIYLFVAFSCIFFFYNPRDESESILFGICWPLFLGLILMISPFIFVSFLGEKWHNHKSRERVEKLGLKKIKEIKERHNPHV